MDKNSKKVIVFGSGYMAEEYLKVLKAVAADVRVLARNSEKAEKLAAKYGFSGFGGGTGVLTEKFCSGADLVIIAVPIEALKDVASACLKNGIKKILIEKPGALDLVQLRELSEEGNRAKAQILISYNRRFYNSVAMLKERIDSEGGPLGCFFDFTDREKDILSENRSKDTLKYWGFANSSHVIDLAFYLAGPPVEMDCRRAGKWKEHPTGNAFTGSGRTKKCLFSYFSTWAGGGRWDVEISTKKGRYKLCPLEELWFCEKNQFMWKKIEPKDEDDIKFKPGLLKMVRSVLMDKGAAVLPTILDQIEFCGVINRIFGYE